MILLCHKITPPKDFYHKPELQDNNGNTVPMIFAKKGKIPPKEW